MDENQKNSEKNKSSLKNILTKPLFKIDSKTIQYSGLGISLVVTILFFFFIGKWLDAKLDTGVLFTLLLTFVGFGGAFYSFYLSIKRLIENDKKENPKYNKY